MFLFISFVNVQRAHIVRQLIANHVIVSQQYFQTLQWLFILYKYVCLIMIDSMRCAPECPNARMPEFGFPMPLHDCCNWLWVDHRIFSSRVSLILRNLNIWKHESMWNKIYLIHTHVLKELADPKETISWCLRYLSLIVSSQ